MNNNNNLDHLPTELISQIIPHLRQRDLYQCSLVNKRFYTLTNPLLWASPQIHHHNQQLFAISLFESPHLRQHVHALRTTYLNPCIRLLQWMYWISPQQLTSLTIDDASNLTDDVLISFIRQQPQLKTLVLKGLPPSIEPQSFKILGRYCHQLKHLTLAPYYDRKASIFTALASGCRLVKSLDITFHPERNPKSRRALFNGGLFAQMPLERLKTQLLALAGLPHLKHLRLQYPFLDFERLLFTVLTTTTTLKDRTTGPGEEKKKIAWPSLTRLELGLLTPMRDRPAIALIRSHPRLQHFSLEFFADANANATSVLTDRFLEAIPTWLPDLKTLRLKVGNRGNITSVGLRQLVQQCPSLKRVSFRDWDHMTLGDFPEAKPGQWWLEDHDDPFSIKVDALDQETIHRIRLRAGQQQQQQQTL